MSLSPDAILTQDALNLKKLDNLSIKWVLEWNTEELTKTLSEFMELKKKIKKNLIECPVAKIHNNVAQEVLRKISQEEGFQAEGILKGIENQTGVSFEFDKLNDGEIEDELRDLFYSWFSHHEYLQGLYEIGSLIVSYSVPDTLKSYVSEARSCFAFQQYNAVYGLCRTIIEIAIRHRCERMKIITSNKDKLIEFDSYRPGELINKSTRGSLRERVKDIYTDTSSLLHGRKTVSSNDAKKMFKNTLKAVQDLYDNK